MPQTLAERVDHLEARLSKTIATLDHLSRDLTITVTHCTSIDEVLRDLDRRINELRRSLDLLHGDA